MQQECSMAVQLGLGDAATEATFRSESHWNFTWDIFLSTMLPHPGCDSALQPRKTWPPSPLQDPQISKF
jgi:hypothetical protein